MLTSHRRSILLDRLARDGRLVASNLALELGASEDTIRRDLRHLAAEGLLMRVHGGALPASPTHRAYPLRQVMRPEEKRALARIGAGLIRAGQVVIIDGGTTHQALVEALPDDLSCTIVTHSPGLAAALEPFAGVEVVLIGGRLFRHSMVTMGPITTEAYLNVRADLCLLGVTGLAGETGLTTGHPDEAALKTVMMRAAAEVAVLATSDKLGAASPWRIAALERVTTLVTCGDRPSWLPAAVGHLRAQIASAKEDAS
jgi:DeoR/GlpR family transcriptional regulator of sugar metabolism